MKIVKSCGTYSWGGLEIYVLKTCKELQLRGHEVRILCSPNSNIVKYSPDFDIESIPILKKSFVSSIFSLKKFLKLLQPDVIHTHLSHDLWRIVPALKSAGVNSKLILSKCLESGVSKKDIFHRYIYNKLDRLVVVSNFIKENVLQTCPVNKTKIELIHDAVNTDIFSSEKYSKAEAKKHFNIPEDKIAVGLVGRMSPGKGHEDYIRAIRIIKNNHSEENLLFLCAGNASWGEENYARSLHKLAHELNIHKDILFIPHQADIAIVYSALDILVFPSHSESFGLTLIEAMAMKLPVIASNYGGVLDIVIHNESGYLFERKNPDALANSIFTLAGNAELRKSLGENGRRRVEKYFSMTEYITKFEKIYNEK